MKSTKSKIGTQTGIHGRVVLLPLHKERLVSYTCDLPLHELRPYSQPQTAAEEGVSEVWALSPKLPGQAQGKEQGYSPGGVTGEGGRNIVSDNWTSREQPRNSKQSVGTFHLVPPLLQESGHRNHLCNLALTRLLRLGQE